MAPRQRIVTPQSSTYDEASESSKNALSGERKSLLRKQSTLNQTEVDVAIAWHDYFNLVALVRFLQEVEAIAKIKVLCWARLG
jgi:hypothetical protein